VGLERGPLSLVSTTEELLERKVAAPVYKTKNTAVGISHADHVPPPIRKFGTNLVDKLRSLGKHSSLADSGHGVFLVVLFPFPTVIIDPDNWAGSWSLNKLQPIDLYKNWLRFDVPRFDAR
jgi:hypothetical protein